jgi:hypothetical protein
VDSQTRRIAADNSFEVAAVPFDEDVRQLSAAGHGRWSRVFAILLIDVLLVGFTLVLVTQYAGAVASMRATDAEAAFVLWERDRFDDALTDPCEPNLLAPACVYPGLYRNRVQSQFETISAVLLSAFLVLWVGYLVVARWRRKSLGLWVLGGPGHGTSGRQGLRPVFARAGALLLIPTAVMAVGVLAVAVTDIDYRNVGIP